MGSGRPGQNAKNYAKSANGFKIDENCMKDDQIEHSGGVLGAQAEMQKIMQNQPNGVKIDENCRNGLKI